MIAVFVVAASSKSIKVIGRHCVRVHTNVWVTSASRHTIDRVAAQAAAVDPSMLLIIEDKTQPFGLLHRGTISVRSPQKP
jgi:alkanesulfonate monooxygenase SsuD/methylene tetrahydromethanopterin reductase-like flavin-dependent oxidoreductase (luciferase family)